MATLYVGGNNSQIFAVWGPQFVTGPYAGNLIPTVGSHASGTNQVNPNVDALNNWQITGSNVMAATGRAGVASPQSWVIATATTGAQAVSMPLAAKNLFQYAYMYVNKEAVSQAQTHPYLSQTYDDGGPAFGSTDIDVDIQTGVVLGRTARFGIYIQPSENVANQGIFDAGDQWCIWAKIYVGNWSDAFA